MCEHLVLSLLLDLSGPLPEDENPGPGVPFFHLVLCLWDYFPLFLIQDSLTELEARGLALFIGFDQERGELWRSL